jgi:hypothetical protein
MWRHKIVQGREELIAQSRQSAGLLVPKVLESSKGFNLGRLINKIAHSNEVLLPGPNRLPQIQTNHCSETSRLVRASLCPMQRSLLFEVHKHSQSRELTFRGL